MLPFGQALLIWRIERGLTQEALAHRARISRPNLSAIERGKREVSLKTLRALALALEIRPGLLVDGIGPGQEKKTSSFSRQALERVADRVVHATPLRRPQERRLAELVAPMVRSRAMAAGYRAEPTKGKRTLRADWLVLTSQYPPQVIRSLLQRIADRQRMR